MTTYGFNELEALRIAVEIERTGARYYRACGRLARGADTHALLERLERDETAHAARFEEIYGLCAERAEADGVSGYDGETGAYLSAIAAGLVFPGGVMHEVIDGAALTAERVLLTAIESERSSLLYYQALLEHSPFIGKQALFGVIIDEERRHLIELTDMLTRAKDGAPQP